MKLCNIKTTGGVHLAQVRGDGFADLTAAGFPLTMEQVISGGNIADIEAFASVLPTVPTAEYANILNLPGKLLCVGLNYRSHSEGIHMNVPERPILFSKFANALVPAGSDVELPQWEDTYDYEAELVIVIGKTAWNVSEEDAMEHVFGYTCGNDLSCRAVQKKDGQWLIAKSMPGFGPCGPCIVTADCLDPDRGVGVKSYVNGELRQNGISSDMIFNCAALVSYASKYIRLEPGDLIFTGTPSGVALEMSSDQRRWLKSGDVVDVEIDGIGTLTNRMV